MRNSTNAIGQAFEPGKALRAYFETAADTDSAVTVRINPLIEVVEGGGGWSHMARNLADYGFTQVPGTVLDFTIAARALNEFLSVPGPAPRFQLEFVGAVVQPQPVQVQAAPRAQAEPAQQCVPA